MSSAFKREERTPDPSIPTDIVTIKSASGRTFHAHAHMLAHHSQHFRAALNSSFMEASTPVFDLSQSNEAAVTIFCRWLYRSRSKEGSKVDELDMEDIHGWKPLAEAWKLGDYLRAPDFQHDMVALLEEAHINFATDSKEFTSYFGIGPDSNEFQRAMADKCCRFLKTANKDAQKHALSAMGPEAVLAVSLHMAEHIYETNQLAPRVGLSTKPGKNHSAEVRQANKLFTEIWNWPDVESDGEQW